MKRLLKVFLALCATATLTTVLMAADDEAAPDRGGPRRDRDGVFGDRLRGPAGLDLTDEQRQKAEDLRKKSEEEFRALLTPEQQAKLDAFRSRRFDYDDAEDDQDSADEDSADTGNPERWVEGAMKWDANKDGSLDKEELTKMSEAMAARRQERIERRGDRVERRDDRVEGRDDRQDRRDDRLDRRDDRLNNNQ